MKGPIGPRRHKGIGLVGMGRGDLARGGGIVLKKPLPSKVIQNKNDKAGIKSRIIERSKAGFAQRTRMAKSQEPDKKSL